MDTKNLVLELWLKLGESLERLKLRSREENVLHLFWAARVLRDVENKLIDEKFDWAVARLDTLSLDILDIYDEDDLKRTTEDVQRFRKEVGSLVSLIEKGSNADTLVTFLHHQKAFFKITDRMRELGIRVDTFSGRVSSKGENLSSVPKCVHGNTGLCMTCHKVQHPKEGFTFIEPPSSPQEARVLEELRVSVRDIEPRSVPYRGPPVETEVLRLYHAPEKEACDECSGVRYPDEHHEEHCSLFEIWAMKAWEGSKASAVHLGIDVSRWQWNGRVPLPTTKPCGEMPSAELALRHPCYGKQHQDKVAECQTCSFSTECRKARASRSARPRCWGAKLEANHLECRNCAYSSSCREELVRINRSRAKTPSFAHGLEMDRLAGKSTKLARQEAMSVNFGRIYGACTCSVDEDACPQHAGTTREIDKAMVEIAKVQAAGGVAAFVDIDHELDVHVARRLGVRIEELLISQPDTSNQANEIQETLTRSGSVDLIYRGVNRVFFKNR